MKVLILILEYINWWFPILALSAPVLWAFIYHYWYYDYRKRKEAESWERINKFFAENADKYPEAAAFFGMARFWASPQGYDAMYQIKKAEYAQAPGE